MLFNSFEFLFCFLPIAFAGYFLLNRIKKYQWANFFLMAMSLYFYGYYKISYLWIILCSILLNYIIHRTLLTKEFQAKKGRKAILLLGILANVGILFYFKYFNFTLEIVSALTKRTVTFAQIALPLGISFFTFQQLGFVVDSYKRKVPQQNIINYALFVTFFPQLIAGPIVNHEEMLPQFVDTENKKIQAENLYLGARAFIYGLAKKVLIADTLGVAVNWGYQYYMVLDGFNTALVLLMYSLQLYYDFSGYCDMARGLGYFFNIKIPVNFDSPFKSKNVVEFWKRWHITLGRFFTGYVYIPLGGNRKGFGRSLRNVFIVFFVSGIWHGAGWTFVVWGLLHAVAQLLTRIWWKVKERYALPRIKSRGLKGLVDTVSVVCCFVFVVLAFGIFRAESLTQVVDMLGKLFAIHDFHISAELATPLCFKEVAYVLNFLNLETLSANPVWQMLAFLILLGGITWGCRNIYVTEGKCKANAITVLYLGVLFAWSVLSLSNVSTFLYFNF